MAQGAPKPTDSASLATSASGHHDFGNNEAPTEENASLASVSSNAASASHPIQPITERDRSLAHSHSNDDDEDHMHEPPNPILGPVADLERGITSFESLQRQQQRQQQQLQQLEEAKLDRFQTAKTNQSSKTNLTQSSRKSLRVKHSEKRGLLAGLVIVPEYHDARDYPLRIKYLIVCIIALASITGPMGTSIMLPAIDDIVDKLHTTTSMVNVSVGIYLLSLGIFPLWWSSFSERFGRRSVYFISFVLFVAFSIGTSLSPSIGALIVLRVLQGGSSASVQAVGAGTIADLFAPQERGKAMGWYYLGPLMGPFLAPIVGGAVSQAWGWRATQWLLMIFAACNLLSITFMLPETLRKLDNLAVLKSVLQRHDDQHQHVDEKKEEHADGGSSNSSGQGEKLEPHDVEPRGITTDTIDDNELQRVATNMSRRSSTRSIRSIIEEEEEEGPIYDPVMPTLSRLTTNRSNYSRRIQQNYLAGEIRRSMSNMPLEPRISAGAGTATPSVKSNIEGGQQEREGEEEESRPRTKMQEFRTNAYDLFIRPLHSLVLLRYPPVLLVIIYSGISFAVIYFFNMTISYEYAREPYHFSQIIVGLMYIPNSVTYLAASMIGGRWNDHLLNQYAKKHGELVPESRISWNLVLAVILYPMACLIFGWTIKYGEFWLVPLIGTAICGFASMLVIGATVTYLVDSLPGKGATGVALNNLIRQILAAIATFIVEPLLRAIGPGILFSILMGILTVASVILVYLKRRGAYFREHYDLMMLYDKL